MIELRAFAVGDDVALGVPGCLTQSAQGDRSRIAVRDGRVVGCVGTVLAPPWMYIWPLVTDDDEAAAMLLEEALRARTSAVSRSRIGVRPGEEAKRRAVLARGFTPSIQFHELAHPLALPVAGCRLPVAGSSSVLQFSAIDRESTRALHNLTFSEIDNTAPLDASDFAYLLDGPTAWPDATAVFADPTTGALLGFVIALRGTDEHTGNPFGVLEAIGVTPTARGRGLARAMTDWLLDQARAIGMAEVRSVVAGTNAGSLALHRAAGFIERERKQMYDLTAV